MSIFVKIMHNPLSENQKKHATIGLVVLMALCGLFAGCKSDTVSTPGGGAGNVGPVAGGASGTDAIQGPTSFSAELQESVNEVPIMTQQFQVRALDNNTGQALAGFETRSDASSMVYFSNLPPGPVGFLVVGIPNESIDTYQFNIDSNEKNETLWVVATSSVQMAPTLANVILNPDKATAAGAIYWINPATLEEEPVGCATVRIDATEGEIRYFGSNNLPTTDTARADAQNQEVRTSTNPLNGKYYIANTSPGSHTVTMMLNGQDMGSTTMMLFIGRESTDGQYSISISNIYVQNQSANPTPPGCM
ncbi:MAG: hypothetical protein JXA30_14225 [Deltaproteobacteria bacterium]|nr:hypothetical protein [Deltaproteobacteria bacterium]